MSRLCPIPGCGAALKPGHLMCLQHWSSITVVQRREVNAALKSFHQCRSQATLRAYRAARNVAIEAAAAKAGALCA